MNRRNGITLTEVLVTIFVMAIGLLAVLALFPLAALNMSQAIVDDRVGHCAANAVAIANMHMDFLPVNDWGVTLDGAQNVNAQRPQAGTAAYFIQGPGPAPVGNGPSYPIFVDPYGMATGSYIANNSVTRIQRVDVPWRYKPPTPPVTNPPTNPLAPPIPQGNLLTQFYYQNFVLLDDVAFNTDGTAMATLSGNAPVANSLVREGRYSWAYMLRRPRSACAELVDMQVVIYHQRSVYKTSAGSPETMVPVTGAVQGGSSITIASAPLRKGMWLLDVTPGEDLIQYGPVHAFWYRVQNVSTVSTGQLQLEIQPAIRTPTLTNVVIMENVVDVFDRGPGWKMPYWRYDE
jgi:hypothetical protein